MSDFSLCLSHIELNVSDYRRSILFYDRVLCPFGWSRLVCTRDFTSYSNGKSKIILCPTDPIFAPAGFHRKRTGLNHLALYAKDKEHVDRFYSETLVAHKIPTLYEEGPSGDADYYAVHFEDPDRMKIEVVYAPHYCDPKRWPNCLESDFDPYAPPLEQTE